MGNMHDGKGSQFWMQEISNNENLSDRLAKELNVHSLKWIFPRDDDGNKEYQISSLLKKTGIVDDIVLNFWPSSGPHWDGAALSDDSNILYLFEAKAHKDEMKSVCRSDNDDNKKLIIKSMKNAFDFFSHSGKGDFSLWSDGYYQLGNRLTFLYELNKKVNIKHYKIKKVELVLLNVVNDSTFIKTEKQEWEQHYKDVFNKMIGDEGVPDKVRLVYFNAE